LQDLAAPVGVDVGDAEADGEADGDAEVVEPAPPRAVTAAL
jgi:hypothetical protein